MVSSGHRQSIIRVPFQTSLSNAVFSFPVRDVSVRASYAGKSSVKNFSLEDAASEKRYPTLFEQGISPHQYADYRFVLNGTVCLPPPPSPISRLRAYRLQVNR